MFDSWVIHNLTELGKEFQQSNQRKSFSLSSWILATSILKYQNYVKLVNFSLFFFIVFQQQQYQILHLSSLNLYHLISTVDVILWFRFFINSVLAYVHVPHIYCLIISLNWYFVNSGSKRSRCFIHYLNIQYASRYLFVLFYYYYYYYF